ncbi:hypothetical protein WA016_01359 [Myxococcus stipitatus]
MATAAPVEDARAATCPTCPRGQIKPHHRTCPHDTIHLHAFDIATATWRKRALPLSPAARAESLMIPGPCDGCVSITGGVDRPRPEPALGAGLLREPGRPVRHSSALVVEEPRVGQPGKKTCFAFGGVGHTLPRFATTSTGLRNDVAVHDEGTGWRLFTTAGEKPAPRAWAPGGYGPDSHSLLVFGGERLGASKRSPGPGSSQRAPCPRRATTRWRSSTSPMAGWRSSVGSTSTASGRRPRGHRRRIKANPSLASPRVSKTCQVLALSSQERERGRLR